ncbi:MAG: hypothetical protein ACO1OD_09415 [Croceibacterium sp.]
MHTEGNEIHAEADEARAGSTPNIVRWVLAISLLAAVLLLSAIWIFGAATTDEEDRVATATDRIENSEDGESTDSIVSGDEQFEFGEDTNAAAEETAATVAESDAPPAEASPTPE